MGNVVLHHPAGRFGALRLAALVLALLVLPVLVAACSDDAPSEDAASVRGKTPVVRPEDVHARGGNGGASVLAPDYRQKMTADLDAEARAGARRVGGVPAVGRAPVAASAAQVAPAGPGAASVADRTVKATGNEVAVGAGSASGGFPLSDCRQLVLVVSPRMNATTAVLRRFVRQGPQAPWHEVGQGVSCLLGRGGLGYGRGLVPMPAGPEKKQGDGRTPAGFFSLPEAFGYADDQTARAAGVRLPYTMVTDRVACVADPAVPQFGRVVGPEERPEGGFARQERMVRADKANIWGVVIGHNREAPVAGAGSCVFVNVRPAGGPPTGGSIGCPEAAAAALTAWLDPAAKPVLAVLPQPVYRERRAAWGLP
ncbi:conserved hypothetical protein [Solidesulfovibrio fructosivorans JJ]]|uniref:Uncharacterized protein n=1 Tax=Solidesulfovibrio fructosivorans JJ] TaxID=596151 RepID=E1K2F1_SOLFR|nr:hypothetical protein [Solidesulfovibrio fructosivorans]EFL49208.1 conserved hypothetical protein [Solidesulfovibrio fructosivorans JJ]]